MNRNQNSSIAVPNQQESLSPFFNVNTSAISFFDKSARMSLTGVFEDTMRESNYQAVLAQSTSQFGSSSTKFQSWKPQKIYVPEKPPPLNLNKIS
jgi:hypothetical protein